MRARLRLRNHLGTQRLTGAVPAATRALDVGVVLVLSVLALPLAAVIAIGILIDSSGPVLHRTVRVGRSGRLFVMLKFRTMVRDAPDGPLRVAGDERETPFGALLSRTRLNELPQLWNILRGDMRLVGPRPELAEFVREYPDAYAEILSVAPGLTGTNQLLHLDEPEVLAALPPADRRWVYVGELLPSKLEADLDYVRGRSRRGDALLLLRTLVLPLTGGMRALRPAMLAYAAAAITLTGLYGVLLSV